MGISPNIFQTILTSGSDKRISGAVSLENAPQGKGFGSPSCSHEPSQWQGLVVAGSRKLSETDVISGTTLCWKRYSLNLNFQHCGSQGCVPVALLRWVGPSSLPADGASTRHGATEPEAPSSNVLPWGCRSLTLRLRNSPGSGCNNTEQAVSQDPF